MVVTPPSSLNKISINICHLCGFSCLGAANTGEAREGRGDEAVRRCEAADALADPEDERRRIRWNGGKREQKKSLFIERDEPEGLNGGDKVQKEADTANCSGPAKIWKYEIIYLL